MKSWIVGYYTIPVLLIVGASVSPMDTILVVLIGALTCVVMLFITWLLLGSAPTTKQRRGQILIGATACLAIVVSIMTAHWPLRAGYFLSRASFDRLAQDVHAGQPFVGPKRVGLFNVVEAQVSRHGIVCLWVNTDPQGKIGFVQRGSDHVPFNIWSMLSLDDGWQFVAED